jgi:hypothetical protein
MVVGEQAMAHVCRLLDIVSCTTMFPKLRDGANKHKSSKQGRPATPPSQPAPASAKGHVSGSGEQGKKYRPVESEIFEISRLPVGSEIFPLSSEIFIFLKFYHPNRCQSPTNTLTLIHV